jgi:hypothetical protein
MHKAGKRSSAAPIAWVLEGRAFVIQDREQLVQHWFPKFFLRGKFQSFTRKLYRWEFRQVNLPKDMNQNGGQQLYFAHPYFQRDRKELMMYMRSVTAARTRRQQQQQQQQQKQQQQQQQQSQKKAPPPSSTPAALSMPPGATALKFLNLHFHRPAPLVLPQGPHASANTLNPYSTYLSSLVQQQQQPQLQQHNSFTQADAIHNLGQSNQQLSQAATLLGILQANPQLQQNLLVARLLGNLQSQPLTPNFLSNPVEAAGLSNLLGQTSWERKAAQEDSHIGNEAEQARLRQAAEILLLALNAQRNGGPSSSSQK